MKNNNIKNGKKSDFKDIFFKLATNGQGDKEFLLTSKFGPKGLSVPGAIYMYKSFKMCLNHTSKRSELLLVTRSNDNHSPGPVMREVSP